MGPGNKLERQEGGRAETASPESREARPKEKGSPAHDRYPEKAEVTLCLYRLPEDPEAEGERLVDERRDVGGDVAIENPISVVEAR